jgi:type I phosphodiesterase/nucleotide pyrophosphatase
MARERGLSGVRAVVVASLLTLACARAPATPTKPPAPLVTIVVDQMAAWIAAERWPTLPPTGGFQRLMREGTYFRDMRYAHAVTDTAPGHAALYTGNVPRSNGIFANEIVPRDGGAPRSILEDAETRVVGVDAGKTERAGSSLRVLRGDTLADALQAQAPGARVFSLSLKDRGALFAAGRTPTTALWLDTTLQQMVSSTAFPAPPRWAIADGGRAALTRAASGGWALTADETAFVRQHAETADDQTGEGDYAGLGVTFPHPIGAAKALRATPAGDRVLFALAEDALRAMASDGRPLLLALSLSSNDYVAHVFGPHSWEAWDELLRLDRALADFLTFLDHTFGVDGYAVMLTADHGSAALPELAAAKPDPWCARPADERARWQFPCDGTRRRLEQPEIVGALERAFGQTFGPGPWISGVADPLVFLTARGRALDAAARVSATRAAQTALEPLGVAQVIDVRAETACSPTGESLPDLVCRSVVSDEPADLYLVVAPGAFFDAGYPPGHGMSHGSPYLYDRSVPLLVRAPGRFAAGVVHEAPVSFTTFTRTAAALLGIVPPSERHD